jgi:LPXTG-site transpeptidase (sortase) family protein
MAAVIGVLLLGLGAAGILFSLRAKTRQPYWADWFLKTGIALFFIGAVFGLVSLGLRPAPTGEQPLAQATVQPSALDPTVKTALARGEPPIIMPEFPFAGDPDEPAQLPDFPVPSPTIQATAGPTEKQPDTSAITRISIPALNLDTVVKYVPFDGYSWMIAGLNQEIAWMGETSWPGLGGNTALAGHVTLRSGADGPFRYLSDLGYGDEVHIYTEENEYVYQVREQQTVTEGDLSVVDPSEQPRLTLITCAEWSKDAKMYLSRLVVVSDLVKVDPLVNTTQGN